jgi:nitrile hydratase accessory protein
MGDIDAHGALPPDTDIDALNATLDWAMNEAGQFTWAEWTEAFGACLKDRGAARPLDGSADYYAAWLATLEALLDRNGMVPEAEARTIRAAWEGAYLSTPHGQPVRLPG